MFENVLKNRKVLLLLIILNLIGVFLSFLTYIRPIILHLDQFYLIPFFMVSFWLYLLAFLFLLFVYLKVKVPNFLESFAFAYCFVYGFGSFIFYPLFIIFVKGFSFYHLWNIFAHGFVGLLSLLFLQKIKNIKLNSIIWVIVIFIIKDVMDLLFGGFLYFVNFKFSFFLKVFLIFLIIGLQIVSIYLLSKKVRLK